MRPYNTAEEWNAELLYIRAACKHAGTPASMLASEKIFMRYCAMQCRFAAKDGDLCTRDGIRAAVRERRKRLGPPLS